MFSRHPLTAIQLAVVYEDEIHNGSGKNITAEDLASYLAVVIPTLRHAIVQCYENSNNTTQPMRYWEISRQGEEPVKQELDLAIGEEVLEAAGLGGLGGRREVDW